MEFAVSSPLAHATRPGRGAVAGGRLGRCNVGFVGATYPICYLMMWVKRKVNPPGPLSGGVRSGISFRGPGFEIVAAAPGAERGIETARRNPTALPDHRPHYRLTLKGLAEPAGDIAIEDEARHASRCQSQQIFHLLQHTTSHIYSSCPLQFLF